VVWGYFDMILNFINLNKDIPKIKALTNQ